MAGLTLLGVWLVRLAALQAVLDKAQALAAAAGDGRWVGQVCLMSAGDHTCAFLFRLPKCLLLLCRALLLLLLLQCWCRRCRSAWWLGCPAC